MAPIRSGKVLVVLAFILVTLLVVGIFLPAIASATVARGIIANAVEAHIDGTVEVEAVKLGWAAPQRVRGLRITDSSGREAGNLDVTVASGLLALTLGSPEAYVIGVTGELRGALRQDGSSSLEAIVAADATAAAAPATPEPSQPGSPMPDVRIDIDSLKVALTLETAPGQSAGNSIEMTDLDGHIDLTPGGSLVVELASPTTSSGKSGRVALTVAAEKLVDTTGNLTARGATVAAELTIDSLPVPFDPAERMISGLALSLGSNDLADELTVRLVATTQGDGANSTLNGDLTFNDPVRDDGTFNVELGTLSGTLSGDRVPTALLQPVFMATPIVLARDLGPTVNVDATFTPVSADATAGSNIGVKLTAAPNASLEVTASVTSDGAIAGGPLDARVLVQPELVAGLVDSPDGPALTQPVPLHLHLDSFALPAPDAEGNVLLAQIAFVGSLSAEDTLQIALGGDAARRLDASGAKLGFTSASLGAGVHLTGGAAVVGGRLEIDEQISNLLDAKGGIDTSRIAPLGEITLSELDGAKVAAMLGFGAGRGADRSFVESAIAEDLAAGPVNVSLKTTPDGEGLHARVKATTSGINATVEAHRNSDRFRLVSANSVVTVRPPLVAALQAESDDPVALTAAVLASLTVNTFDLPAGIVNEEGELPDVPVSAVVKLNDAVLRRGGDAEAVMVRGLAMTVGASLRGTSDMKAKGGASLLRTDGTPMGKLDCDLVASKSGERLVPRGTVALSDIALPAVESLGGMKPGALTRWVGSPGTLSLVFAGAGDAQRVTTTFTFPNLNGKAMVSIIGDELTVESDALALTLRRKTLEQVLNATSEDQPVAAETRLAVAEDVPMTVSIRRCRLPLGIASGEPVAAGSFELQASLVGGPLMIADATGVMSTLDTLSLSVESDDLANGVGFTIVGRSTAAALAEPGSIDVTGRVTNLLTPARLFSLDDAKLDMQADAKHVPTMLADAGLGLQHLLVAALGVEMQSTFTAAGFSRSTGRIDGTITTPFGELAGAIEGTPGFLASVSDAPLHGSLDIQPELRERLLRKIHPVLADIRATEDRLRFRLTGPTQIPTDGDVSKLNGDLEIRVGQVEFTAGSDTLGLLGLFMANPNKNVPGSIEPIIVHIRNGIVTYDRFAVRIEKYTMVYEGRIDLTNNTCDLRTELPLAALGQTFKEAKGYVDRIVVPIVTRGSLDSPTTKIDPSFDIGKALFESGVGGLLDDALKKKGVGNLLGDLLGEKKK